MTGIVQTHAFDAVISEVRGIRTAIRAMARSLVFVLKALPWTSGAIDRVTPQPVIETISYPTHDGHADAEVYRPSTSGPHPGVVVSLGVVPVGVEHPHRARFAEALARAGFAALLHWSPAMRDLRLDPEDVDDLASAYRTLIAQPYVDPARSGLIGTCVGGSIALMAAAEPDIRDRLAFVSAYAPYASMWTLALDIASASRDIDGQRERWQVDPLVWATYVRCITDRLGADEARLLRDAFGQRFTWDASKTVIVESPADAPPGTGQLSEDGRAVLRLLQAGDLEAVESALHGLPDEIQALLTAMSPVERVEDIHAARIVLLHDRRDHMIPVSESRRLWDVLSGRPGATYTELGFQHLDPTRLSLLQLARELPRLCRAIYPLYRQTTA